MRVKDKQLSAQMYTQFWGEDQFYGHFKCPFIILWLFYRKLVKTKHKWSLCKIIFLHSNYNEIISSILSTDDLSFLLLIVIVEHMKFDTCLLYQFLWFWSGNDFVCFILSFNLACQIVTLHHFFVFTTTLLP